jgi:hypothetical protein
VSTPDTPPETAADRDRTRSHEEHALVTAGQRRINSIWEVTQALIAIGVTGSTLTASVSIILRVANVDGPIPGIATASFLLLSNAFFLVIGFYFGRTNHTKMGGISDERRRD